MYVLCVVSGIIPLSYEKNINSALIKDGTIEHTILRSEGKCQCLPKYDNGQKEGVCPARYRKKDVVIASKEKWEKKWWKSVMAWCQTLILLTSHIYYHHKQADFIFV